MVVVVVKYILEEKWHFVALPKLVLCVCWKVSHGVMDSNSTMVLPHFQATHVASNEQNCVCGQKGETTRGQMAPKKPCPGYMNLESLAAVFGSDK